MPLRVVKFDALADPLMHLVRNSLDHGLEPTPDRLAASKSARGTLRLRAEQRGDRVIVTVADDGRGLAPEKIRAKAIARGLLARADGVTLHPAGSSPGRKWTLFRRIGVPFTTCYGRIDEEPDNVFQVKSDPHGESWTGFSASRVTAESGIQPSVIAAGRSIGPWRATSGVGSSITASVITLGGHSRMQMEQPMHSPTWTGCSIIQGNGLPPSLPTSTPGAAGRLMSSASTGQTSMQTPQLMQLAWSMSMR